MMKSVLWSFLGLFIFIFPHPPFIFSYEVEPEAFLHDYTLLKKEAAKSLLTYFHSLFLTKYAPLKWKQKRYHWDPNYEFQYALDRLEACDFSTLDDIKPLFSRFVSSPQDAHVCLFFQDQRIAHIPLSIDEIDNRYYVTESSIPGIDPGDELLLMNGYPPLEHLKKVFYGEVETYEARANFLLKYAFSRMGTYCPLPDPEESVHLTLMHQGIIQTFDLDWHITTTYDHLTPSQKACMEYTKSEEPKSSQIARVYFPLRLAKETNFETDTLKFNQVHKISSASFEKQSKIDWDIFRYLGVSIGYLKIDSFWSEDIDFETLDLVLELLENKTNCLILDVRGNPGGIDFEMFGLARRLTGKPLINLMESRLLDEGMIDILRHRLAHLTDVLKKTTCDEELQHQIPGYGLPCDRYLLESLCLEASSCIEEWEKGFTCSRFGPLRGFKILQPHPQTTYTKPLYILLDEKSMSCTEMLAAIMQDNHRAKILGRRTAGAGGHVEFYSLPNAFGIKRISLTSSLVLRNTGYILEDNGICPDFEYPKSIDSLINPLLEKKWAIRIVSSDYKKNDPS